MITSHDKLQLKTPRYLKNHIVFNFTFLSMTQYIKSNPSFEAAYQKLNTKQKEAVDTLEGPLLVIAGPGTGKTQILAIRIGNILLNTDLNPRNILCLTFTDSGAINMRDRLLEFIGPTAYEIAIHTFHSFCNMVIRENPESFEQYSSYEIISDLEKSQLLLKMLDSLDRNHIFYRYNRNYKRELYALPNLFEKIKKENWNPDQMLNDIDAFLEKEKDNPDYIYKKKSGNNKQGDFKQAAYDKEKLKFEKTKAAIGLYTKYQEALDEIERYEFEDMIRWVLNKFQTDDFLLAKYQELYQYILVDEFQDTNGAQNQILSQLLSYFDTPNVFAVGDDDQAIYRFQGANVENMSSFDRKYTPAKIVLTENYRSSQLILNAADALIKNNTERLVNLDVSLSKNLIASGTSKQFTALPHFYEFEFEEHEILYVCQQVKFLLDQNIPGNQIAILFLKNNDAEAFIKWFEVNKIPYQTSKQLNVLHEPLIKHLINILNYICQSFRDPIKNDELLYKILHAPFIPIPSESISKLAWFLQEKRSEIKDDALKEIKLSLLELMGNENELAKTGIEDFKTILEIAAKIQILQKEVLDLSPQTALEKILQEFNVLPFLLESHDKIQYLQILNSFFEFLKSETQKHPESSLLDFTNLLAEYIKNNISLPLNQFIGSRQGVVLSTIYKAKGLEYEHVFMIHNSEEYWSPTRQNNFKLMEGYVNEKIDSEEDRRRLFYVGVTRAKLHLYLSYYKYKSKDKKQTTLSKFVTEMLHEETLHSQKLQVEESDLLNKLIIDMSPMKKDYKLLEDQLFEKFILKFRLNPTALSKYLDCPLAFYYEKVLQIPSARTPSLGFGNAVHTALEYYMNNRPLLKQGAYNAVLKYFEKGMEKYRSHFTSFEYENYLIEGNKILPKFIEFHAESWLQSLDFKTEFKIPTEFQGVPLSGKLDRIDWIQSGIRVMDYKTGKADIKRVKPPSDKIPNGSDYWQQLVFYAILLKNYSPTANARCNSTLYFVMPDENETFQHVEIIPTEADLDFLSGLIKDTYSKIVNRKFTPGCGKKECEWCNYINAGKVFHLTSNEEEEEEI